MSFKRHRDFKLEPSKISSKKLRRVIPIRCRQQNKIRFGSERGNCGKSYFNEYDSSMQSIQRHNLRNISDEFGCIRDGENVENSLVSELNSGYLSVEKSIRLILEKKRKTIRIPDVRGASNKEAHGSSLKKDVIRNEEDTNLDVILLYKNLSYKGSRNGDLEDENSILNLVCENVAHEYPKHANRLYEYRGYESSELEYAERQYPVNEPVISRINFNVDKSIQENNDIDAEIAAFPTQSNSHYPYFCPIKRSEFSFKTANNSSFGKQNSEKNSGIEVISSNGSSELTKNPYPGLAESLENDTFIFSGNENTAIAPKSPVNAINLPVYSSAQKTNLRPNSVKGLNNESFIFSVNDNPVIARTSPRNSNKSQVNKDFYLPKIQETEASSKMTVKRCNKGTNTNSQFQISSGSSQLDDHPDECCNDGNECNNRRMNIHQIARHIFRQRSLEGDSAHITTFTSRFLLFDQIDKNWSEMALCQKFKYYWQAVNHCTLRNNILENFLSFYENLSSNKDKPLDRSDAIKIWKKLKYSDKLPFVFEEIMCCVTRSPELIQEAGEAKKFFFCKNRHAYYNYRKYYKPAHT